MLKTLRDISISLAACWLIVITSWVHLNPTLVGYWMAEKDIAYDSIWSEYITDMSSPENN